MGLDCRAYKNIRIMEESEVKYDIETENDDEGNEQIVYKYPINGKQFYINPGFPHAAPDIDANAIYGFSEQYHWRAGSYSGYGEWRNWLATYVAGYGSAREVWNNGKVGDPFYELINFSDCEGTLGTVVCQKLLKDFIAFQYKIDAMETGEDNFLLNYYKNLYSEWKKGLEIASQNGVIVFS